MVRKHILLSNKTFKNLLSVSHLHPSAHGHLTNGGNGTPPSYIGSSRSPSLRKAAVRSNSFENRLLSASKVITDECPH